MKKIFKPILFIIIYLMLVLLSFSAQYNGADGRLYDIFQSENDLVIRLNNENMKQQNMAVYIAVDYKNGGNSKTKEESNYTGSSVNLPFLADKVYYGKWNGAEENFIDYYNESFWSRVNADSNFITSFGDSNSEFKINVSEFLGNKNVNIIVYLKDLTTDSGAGSIIDVINEGGELGTGIKTINNSAVVNLTINYNVSGIIMDKTELMLVENESGILSATVEPQFADNKLVHWSSNNNGIATVNSFGVVRAVSMGVAIITARTDEGDYSENCIVTVTDNIPVTAVTISSIDISVFVGKTLNLSHTILPINASNKNIIWTSDDYEIATVNNEGDVTGVHEGISKVRITTEDGGFIAEATVIVSVKYVTGIELEDQELEVGEQITMKGLIPEDASIKTIAWKSDNTSIAVINGLGELTAVGVGATSISAITQDGEFTDNALVTVVPRQYIVKIVADMTKKNITGPLEIRSTWLSDNTYIDLKYRYNNTDDYTNLTIGWNKGLELKDEDGDGLYSVDVIYENARSSENIQLKLFADGEWEAGVNRIIKLSGIEQEINIAWNEKVDVITFHLNTYENIDETKGIFITYLDNGSGVNKKFEKVEDNKFEKAIVVDNYSNKIKFTIKFWDTTGIEYNLVKFEQAYIDSNSNIGDNSSNNWVEYPDYNYPKTKTELLAIDDLNISLTQEITDRYLNFIPGPDYPTGHIWLNLYQTEPGKWFEADTKKITGLTGSLKDISAEEERDILINVSTPVDIGSFSIKDASVLIEGETSVVNGEGAEKEIKNVTVEITKEGESYPVYTTNLKSTDFILDTRGNLDWYTFNFKIAVTDLRLVLNNGFIFKDQKFDVKIISENYLKSGETIVNDVLLVGEEIHTSKENSDQTIMFKFDDAKIGSLLVPGIYEFWNSNGLGNFYREIKTVDFPSFTLLEDNMKDINYMNEENFIIDSSNLNEDGFNLGNRWFYEGNNNKNGLIVKKAPGGGSGEFKYFKNSLEIDKIFDFGYDDKFSNLYVIEDGDKITISWKKSGEISPVIFSSNRIMFRLTKGKDNSKLTSDYYFDLYNSNSGTNNPVNFMDPFKLVEIDTNDFINETNIKMEDFLNDVPISNNYLDYIFDEASLESVEAEGVRVDYSAGTVDILGLSRGDYSLEIFTLKDGNYSEIVNSVDFNVQYKVVTFNGKVGFKVNRPTIDTIPMQKNGIFRIDYIDKLNFKEGQIEAHFATKMPFEIDLPTVDNLFWNEDERAKTSGMVSRLHEVNRGTYVNSDYENIDEEVAEGKIVVSKSELKDFRYPLDIVFCIDNSGSMQNEIDDVRNGLSTFSQLLVDRGFDVKFNLISFGPEQNKYDDGAYATGNWKNKIDTNGEWLDLKDLYLVYRKNYGYFYSFREYGGYWYDSWWQSRYAFAAKFKNTWFNDVDELSDAFSSLVARSGYRAGQENTSWAIHHAMEHFDSYGRSLANDGTILNDSTGSLESLKWVIYLTDENMDREFPPTTYTSGAELDKTGIHKLTKELGDKLIRENILMTGIYHVGSGETDDYTGDDAPGGRNGVNPSDQGDVSLNEFVFLEDRYKRYEMGSAGEYTQSALLDSVNHIGIIQRWKVAYETPFLDSDGTIRQIDFILGNLKDSNSDGMLDPVDVNAEPQPDPEIGGREIVYNRKYKAPDIKVEAEIIQPSKDNVEFKVDPNNPDMVLVIMRAKSLKTTGEEFEVPIVKMRVEVREVNNAAGVIIAFAETSDETLSKSADGYYYFNALLNKSLLLDSGFEFFDVKALGYNSYGEASTTRKDIFFSKNAPRIEEVSILNKTNKLLWEKLYGNESGFLEEEARGNLFTDDEINKFSKTKYEKDYIGSVLTGDGAYTFEYLFESNINMTFSNRNNNYDGHYAKTSDKLEIKLVFVDENISDQTITSDFSQIGSIISGPVIEEFTIDLNGNITTVEEEIVGKRYIYTWELEVTETNESSEATPSKIMFDIEDDNGDKMTDKISWIDAIVIDNTPPNIIIDIPVKSDGISYVNSGENLNTVYKGTDDEAYIVNKNFKLKYSSDDSVRAYRFDYYYDYTRSDLISKPGIGNHTKDVEIEEGLFRFYNREYYNTYSEPELDKRFVEKNVSTDNYDDGEYDFIISSIDKAGNFSSVSNMDKEIIVDTIFPKIVSIDEKGVYETLDLFEKVYDANSNLGISINNTKVVKKGDEFVLKYKVQDYNRSKLEEDYKGVIDEESKYLGIKLANSYLGETCPEYSGLLDKAESPKFIFANENELENSVEVFIGDAENHGLELSLPNNSYNAKAVSNKTIGVTNSLENGIKNVLLGVKDLAGNMTYVDIEVEIDNLPPVKAGVTLYGYEELFQGIDSTVSPHIQSHNAQVVSDRTFGIKFTNGGPLNNEFYISIGTEDIDDETDTTNYLVFYNSDILQIDKSAYDTLAIGNKVPVSELIGNAKYNELNQIRLIGLDDAGGATLPNWSDEDDVSLGKIFLDTVINDMDVSKLNFSITAKNINNHSYSLEVNLSEINEFVGIYMFKILTLSTIDESFFVTPDTASYDIPGAWIPMNENIDPSITLKKSIATANIDFVLSSTSQLIGSRAKLEVELMDQLGNRGKVVEIEILIPKQDLYLEATVDGEEKAKKSTLKIIGDKEFEIRGSKEGGKTSK